MDKNNDVRLYYGGFEIDTVQKVEFQLWTGATDGPYVLYASWDLEQVMKAAAHQFKAGMEKLYIRRVIRIELSETFIGMEELKNSISTGG